MSRPPGLPHLETLRVSHNVILAASLCHLSPGSRLTSLDLSSTNLTRLAWRLPDCGCAEASQPASLPVLTSLNISGNYLDLADLQLRDVLPSLTTVNLGQLNTTAVGEEETAGLPLSLAELEFSNMPALQDFRPGALSLFRGLEKLVVTGNKGVRWLPPGLLPQSDGPLTVNLSSNGLTWLDPSSLPWPRVSLLDLTDNPLHCDCELSWLTEFSTLTGAVCASPPALADLNMQDINISKMSCALLRPAQISVLSLVLVLVSLLLGCVSFGK